MPIVLTSTRLIDEGYNAVRLARYAQRAGFSECAFWGVHNPSDDDLACRPIQTLDQRIMIAHYLAEAQDEIEQVTGYPMSARWFAGEQHPFASIIHAKWVKLLDVGVRAVTNISLGAATNYAADPCVIGPIATTVTDTSEIHVYHPGTDIEIDPSSITIAGGAVTIQVPRCRMVNLANVDNDENGLNYTDVPPSVTSPFEATVDVKRVYNDPSTQGVLVFPHQTSSASQCMCPSCGGSTETACEYIRNANTGAIDLLRATYASGVWTATACTCATCSPQLAQVNYKAGLVVLPPQAEDAIIRLAHSKMPKPPCGCGALMEMWTADRHVPDSLTRERENCPFGMSDGAWVAWRFANAMMALRAGVL